MRLLIYIGLIANSFFLVHGAQDAAEQQRIKEIEEIQAANIADSKVDFLLDLLLHSPSEKVYGAASEGLKKCQLPKVSESVIAALGQKDSSVMHCTWLWLTLLDHSATVSADQAARLLDKFENDFGMASKLAALVPISSATRDKILAKASDTRPAVSTDVYFFVEIELGKSSKYPNQKKFEESERKKDEAVLRTFLEAKYPPSTRFMSGCLLTKVGDPDAKKFVCDQLESKVAEAKRTNQNLSSVVSNALLANDALGGKVDERTKNVYAPERCDSFVNEVIAELKK